MFIAIFTLDDNIESDLPKLMNMNESSDDDGCP